MVLLNSGAGASSGLTASSVLARTGLVFSANAVHPLYRTSCINLLQQLVTAKCNYCLSGN